MTKPLLIAAIVSVLAAGVVAGQTTAFNFNGHLSHLGLPVNGRHDLRFALYGSQAGADLVGGPIVVNSVAVRGGIFNCRLDFGEQVFNGSARWLDISVRPNGTENFTRLSPRVELTSAPYAVRAKEASVAANVATGSAVRSLNSLKDNVALAAGPNVTLTTNGNTLTIGSTGGGGGGPWSTQNTDVYYTGGNVGVGTSQPQGIMDIHGGASDTSALYVRTDPETSGRGGIIHHQSATYGWQELAQNTSSDTDGYLAFHYVNRTAPAFKISSDVLTLHGNGNVGIGTALPASKLDVRGALTLETGGNAVLYTGTTGTEQNRYLNLINSPTVPSASGLKAGGVLVSDDYSYANPGKNDLVVKGKVTSGGDAIQSRDKGGWVKAMARVNVDGTIARQFSADGGAITATAIVDPSLGTYYRIQFPYQVNDRFISITPFANLNAGIVAANMKTDGCLDCVSVFLKPIDGGGWVSNEFIIVVF